MKACSCRDQQQWLDADVPRMHEDMQATREHMYQLHSLAGSAQCLLMTASSQIQVRTLDCTVMLRAR